MFQGLTRISRLSDWEQRSLVEWKSLSCTSFIIFTVLDPNLQRTVDCSPLRQVYPMYGRTVQHKSLFTYNVLRLLDMLI